MCLCCSPKHPVIQKWQEHLCSVANHRHSTHLHNILHDVRPSGKDLPNINDAMLLQGLIENSEYLCTGVSTTSHIHRTETDLGTSWQVNKLHPSPQPSVRVQMQIELHWRMFDKNHCIDPMPDPTFALLRCMATFLNKITRGWNLNNVSLLSAFIV